MYLARLSLLFLVLAGAGCSHAGYYVAEISVHSTAWAEDVYLHLDPEKIAIHQDTGPTRPVGEVSLTSRQARALRRALENIPSDEAHQEYVPDVDDPAAVEDRSGLALRLRLAPAEEPVLLEMTNCRLAEVGTLVQTMQDIITASAGNARMLLSFLGIVWDPGFANCKKRFAPNP